MLRRHRIQVEQLVAPETLAVDAYTIEEVSYEQAYNHAAAMRVRVGEVLTLEQTFPPETYVVPTAQPLGRLVAHMLEPETDDNVIYWNTMDAWVPRPGVTAASGGGLPNADREPALPFAGPLLVPIYKLMRPTPLAAAVLE
jgi:hypothetical protein